MTITIINLQEFCGHGYQENDRNSKSVVVFVAVIIFFIFPQICTHIQLAAEDLLAYKCMHVFVKAYLNMCRAESLRRSSSDRTHSNINCRISGHILLASSSTNPNSVVFESKEG